VLASYPWDRENRKGKKKLELAIPAYTAILAFKNM
jgi:hypothetical protein